MSGTDPIAPTDELVHPVDPGVWSWNESWFFSWIDHRGGPAGFFRLGALPNQGRAMLWSFVHLDGRWLGIEESRLACADLDLSEGLAYERWALRFGWRPAPPLEGAGFAFEGSALVRRDRTPAPMCRCRSTSGATRAARRSGPAAAPTPSDRRSR